MGVTRVDDLPENRMIQTVADARQVAKERKGSSQRVGGANLAYLVSSSTSTFDWSGQLNGAVGTPAYGQARFIITLTSSTASTPLVDVGLIAYYSTDSGVTWAEYTYERGLSDTYSGTAPEIFRTLTVQPGVENAPGQVKYMLQLFGRLNTYAAFKLQIVGTDTVVPSISRIA